MKVSHRCGRRRLWAAAAVVSVASLLLGACGGASGAGNSGDRGVKSDPDAVDAALKAGGTITYWTWTNAEPQVKAFEKEYPNVHVKLVNAGTGDVHYTKLQNALKAGSGAPDVAQIEYFALPQFALPGYLVDLRQYGFDKFANDYLPSAWESAHGGTDGLYALPQGGGPMTLFYNKKVFDKYHLAVPKTWDEYVADAKQLHQADPTKYITADTGDAGFTMAMIWQAGGRPYKVDGKKITVNFGDEGTKKFTSMWNQLLDGGLLAPYAGWSEEWFKALDNGTIATLPAGGWMAGVIEGLKATKGDWRAAPVPTYDGGQPISSEHGGSHEAVLKQSKNPALAAGFLRWLNHENGNKVYIELGGLPATVADIQSPDFLNHKWAAFAGQEVNKVVVDAANAVAPGWQFLPYQTYANSIFGDTVGKAYQSKGDIGTGLKGWQDALVTYGKQQGFDVTG